jgi:hypothetical protein
LQPSRLDNWISNGKVLNLGYEKPLLKPSFQEFFGRHHALVDEFAINCLQALFSPNMITNRNFDTQERKIYHIKMEAIQSA